MKKAMYIVLILIDVVLLVLIVGLCLPSQRKHTCETIYNASPKEVFDVVTDNVNWQYRRGLKELKIISTDDDKQVWDEYGEDGMLIRFTTREYKPYSFYSFDIESKVMKGYWTSRYQELEDGKTRYTATEYLTIKNPFVRVLNYLFFDIDKYMKAQQEDVRRRLDEL